MNSLDNNPGSPRRKRNRLLRGESGRGVMLQPDVSRQYIVPIVFKTIQIIELLRSESKGLRIEEICQLTGFPKSTIYRIVRTLACTEYLCQESKGIYRLAPILKGGSRYRSESAFTRK
jgi:hypothetical protein